MIVEKTMSINEIVRNSYFNTQFYRSLYDKHNIDIDCFVFEKLPFVTQLDLINHGKDFKHLGSEIFRVSSSSGTTKLPKTVYRTQKDFEISSKVLEWIMLETGISKFDVVYIGQPFDLASFGYLVLEGCKNIGALAIPGGLGQSDERMLDLILYYDVSVIMSAPSRMKQLTLIIQKKFTSRLRKQIITNTRKIILAGEPLKPADRNYLANFWDCKIYDYYGSEETDSLGYSKESGLLNLMNEYYYFEFIPIDDERYEMVITSLYLNGTPLIRYRLGDIVKLHGKIDGRHQIEIVGKLVDTLNLYDGVKLYGFQVEEVIKKNVPEYVNYQIICSNKGDGTDYIKVIIHTNNKHTNYQVAISEMEEEIWYCSIDLEVCREIGSVEFNFVVNTEEFIITRRGKTPRVIDMRMEVE